MATSNHETLVYRLAEILIKLNQGVKLDPKTLAEEFGVNLRTIQRDLNVRFAYLPLEKKDGLYSLDPTYLGKITFKDIERFASLAGVRGLFPSLNKEFLCEIFDSRIPPTLEVKGHNYESMEGKEAVFKTLRKAASFSQYISFDYRSKSGQKKHGKVCPYRLINQKGIWYLAGLEDGKIKTFSVSKISNLLALNDTFEKITAIETQITEDDGIWFSNEKIEIVLKVSSEVSDFFKRRKLIANQVIEQELEDGGVIISTTVGHFNQILPIIKYWIPHIEIMSPKKLQEMLQIELRNYLELGH